jgi:cytochrome c oxidase subunit 3
MAGHSSGADIYYVPEQSRLAICMATSVAVLILGAATGMNSLTYHQDGSSAGWYVMLVGLFGFLITLFAWFNTAIKENRAGMNSAQLKNSYVLGMKWFIFSEVMFFACFFGVLFYVRNLAGPWLAGEGANTLTGQLLWPGFAYDWPMLTTPQQAVGGVANQPVANSGIFEGAHEAMSWWYLPFVNTVLLVSSSVTLHFAHHAIKHDKRKPFNIWLGVTLLLGFAFVYFQVQEYKEAYSHLGLTLNAGIYGSTFFILTGFHGFHVCMGAIMLTVQWLRSVTKGHFSAEDQFGFEASAWYWHFVDVVWLGLFFLVYII